MSKNNSHSGTSGVDWGVTTGANSVSITVKPPISLVTCPACHDVFLADKVKNDALLDGNSIRICDDCTAEFLNGDKAVDLVE